MNRLRNRIATIVAVSALLLPVFGAHAMTVSPPTFDFNLNPGDTVLDVIQVYNESDKPETIYPVRANFIASKDENGQPVIVSADKDIGGTGLSDWLKLDETGLTVGPKQRINFPFSINVPRDAQPGGHYGTVLLSTVPPKDLKGSVGISSQVGVLILLNVSGDVHEQGAIAEFGFKIQQLWYPHLPIDFFLRFENDGNTHLRPSGNLFIKNWMGRQVASIKVNDAFSSILPRSIRRFEFGWRKDGVSGGDGFIEALQDEWHNFAIGPYTATLVLNYGSKNQVLTEERKFTVWPWHLMTVGGIGLLLLVFLFWAIARAYARAVIRRYERERGGKT